MAPPGIQIAPSGKNTGEDNQGPIYMIYHARGWRRGEVSMGENEGVGMKRTKGIVKGKKWGYANRNLCTGKWTDATQKVSYTRL